MRIIKNIIYVLLIILILCFMFITLKYTGDTVQIHKTIKLTSSYNTKAVVDNNDDKEMVIESNADKEKLLNLPSSCYLMFVGESLLLSIVLVCFVCTSFNKNNLKVLLDNKKRNIIITIILFLVLLITCIILTKTMFKPGVAEEGKTQIYINGAKEVVNKKIKMTGNIDTNYIDKSCIVVKDKGNLVLNSANVNKISGKSSNIYNSKENGVNSTIAVVDNSNASISGTKIKSLVYGSSGLYVRGDKSNVYLNDLTIETKKDYSPSIEIAYLGNVKMSKSGLKTDGKFSPNINIEKDGGNISLDECDLQAVKSSVINSLGTVNIINSKLKTDNTNTITISGNSMVNIKNSKITSSISNNKKIDNTKDTSIIIKKDENKKNNNANILISDSNLNISKNYIEVSVFRIIDNNATINLSNTNIIHTNSKLLDVLGKSNSYLILDNEEISGDIYVDKDSKLFISLSSNTSYSGSFNSENVSDGVNLIIDKTSTLELSKDTYVKSLEDNDKSYNNINLNGHKLFVNNKELEK